MDHPEHDKLKRIAHKSQAVGEFLEWLVEDKEITLCVQGKVYDGWKSVSLEIADVMNKTFGSGTETPEREETSNGYVPVLASISDLLAEFFRINPKTIEAEKRAMLDEIRAQQSA